MGNSKEFEQLLREDTNKSKTEATNHRQDVENNENKKKESNLSIPKSFIKRMIEKPELNRIFWEIAEQETELKVPMLMALAEREFKQLKLDV